MATATDLPFAGDHEAELAPYRAISRSAVVSLLLFLLSLPLVAMAVWFAVRQVGDAVPLGFLGALLATMGAALGLSGRATIRRYPAEYTGGRLALIGLVGGLVLVATGSTVSAYTYLTEVPDGYARLGFWELQPDPDRPDLPVAPKALELSGKPVFIKGYMHPGVASMGKVNHFILVPDMGTCCFGGQPKPTDMIEVYVADNTQRIAYSTHKVKLAGTFLLTTQPTQSLGLNNVWYHLQADKVR